MLYGQVSRDYDYTIEIDNPHQRAVHPAAARPTISLAELHCQIATEIASRK